jgi:hypothetical protein
MFQFSLPAEVGQSVSYPTRGGCAEGTATIKRVFANQKLGAHYLLEITRVCSQLLVITLNKKESRCKKGALTQP